MTWTQAERVLVGGVNSPVRAFRHIGGAPLLLKEGHGPCVIDADGHRFIDFMMGWGALIFGHHHPGVIRALQSRVKRGVLLGLTHQAEVELAQLIIDAVPSVEQVRFTVSGSEACMTAVRLARACTGRSKILTFEGCYHGHGDTLMMGNTAGLPGAISEATVSIPFNDREALERVMARLGDALACAIIEPVAANMGVVIPEPGYLARLRTLTSRYGALLIFDEVVTGFRVAWGGAQALFNISPDLTVFGKIIGGGLPIGALGGPRRIMQRLAPVGDVYHGGTFAGHPLSMAAGLATLRELQTNPPYERLERLGEHLQDGLIDVSQRAGLPVQINRVGSMLTLFFSEIPIHTLAHVKAAHRDRFAQWARALLARGILVPPSPYEAMFLSTVHTETHIEQFLRSARQALQHIKTRVSAS